MAYRKHTTRVYQVITDHITTLLEQGTVPWRKPWQRVSPQNLLTQTWNLPPA